MTLRSTHTFAKLEVSPETFREIYNKLKEADYTHAFLVDGDSVVIDMHGIGLEAKQPRSAFDGPYTVIVNGVKHVVKTQTVSWTDICTMAQLDPTHNWSCVWSNPESHKNGMLHRGEAKSVEVVDRLLIEIMATGNA